MTDDISFHIRAGKVSLDVQLFGVFKDSEDLRRHAITLIPPVLQEALFQRLDCLRSFTQPQERLIRSSASDSFGGSYVKIDAFVSCMVRSGMSQLAKDALNSALAETLHALEMLLKEREMRERELTDEEITTFLAYWDESRQERENLYTLVRAVA